MPSIQERIENAVKRILEGEKTSSDVMTLIATCEFINLLGEEIRKRDSKEKVNKLWRQAVQSTADEAIKVVRDKGNSPLDS